MENPGSELATGEDFRDRLRHHYRAVMPTGAAKGDCKITFPLPHIMRNQEIEKIRDAFYEFFRLRKRPDIFGNRSLFTCQQFEFWNVIWIWQKAHVEHEISVRWNTVAVSEANTGDHQ